MKTTAFAALLSSAACIVACQGDLSTGAPGSGAGTGDPTAPGVTPPGPGPGPGPVDPIVDPPPIPEPETPLTPLRRLSPVEIDRTLEDLFGRDLVNRRHFRAPSQDGMFSNDEVMLAMTPPATSAIHDVIGALAEEFVDDGNLRREVMGCRLIPKDAADGEFDADCLKDFVASFAPKAWRRPVSAEEQAALIGFWEELRGPGSLSLWESTQLLTERILLSPNFLYRVERGSERVAAHDAERRELTQHEVASRLSYLLWGTMPDQELFEAAERGALSTPEEIEAQARRMLRDEEGTPREQAILAMRVFYSEWLGFDHLSFVRKSNKERSDGSINEKIWGKPGYLRNDFKDETSAFFDHIFWESTLDELLTADYSFLNDELAAHYGADLPGSEDGLVKTRLPEGERSGFLTQGAVIGHSKASAITRGAYVLRRLMCQTIPDPPADADDTLPKREPGQTGRDRLNYLTEGGSSCASCHAPMHGVGFGLRNYDEIGRWRASLSDEPEIDASGEVLVDGQRPGEGEAFDGPLGMASILAETGVVERCMLRHLVRFAHGRSEEELDQPALEAIWASSEASGGKFEEILIAFVRSPDFRTRASLIPHEEAP